MNNSFTELRKSYKEHGKAVSQRRLAKLIGIAAPHISELENGRMPSISELKAYHNFFRVSYEYLLGETDMLVSSDVFRVKPVPESETENILRWLNESQKNDEIAIRKTVQYLLGDTRGLVLLFYISAYRQKLCSLDILTYCIEELQKEDYIKYTFKELQIVMKNLISKKFDTTNLSL